MPKSSTNRRLRQSNTLISTAQLHPQPYPCRMEEASAAGRPAVFLLLHLLLSLPSASSDPATNFLLACGSSSPPASSIADPRAFLPDQPFYFSNVTFSLPSSIPLSSSSNSSSLFSTARVLPQASYYSFPIASAGTHLLRLHFRPFSSLSYNLSTARFSVSASSLPLLNASSSPPRATHEFLLNVNVTALTLTFSPTASSFAFVTAIELFSAPTGLLPDSAARIPNTFETFTGLKSKVLQTLYRLNVGGPQVDPGADTTAWRTWENDTPFLSSGSPVGVTKTSTATVNYDRVDSDTSSRDVAPDAVYQSARAMFLRSDPNVTTAKRFNLTWDFPVSSGGTYLVRLHFCNIISQILLEFLFSAYIDAQVANKDIDLSNQVFLVTPIHKDFVVEVAGPAATVRVAVGPSDKTTLSGASLSVNALLNGLEIMELRDGALAPSISSKSSSQIGAIVGGAVGGCLAVVVAVVVLVLVLRKRKRKLAPEANSQSLVSPQDRAGWSPLLQFTASTTAAGSVWGTGSSPTAAVNLPATGLRIPLLEIRSITSNFDSVCQIGSGGFGKVYIGQLPDGNSVAVKRATPGSRQGLPEFQTEITVLSRIRHRHLVSLIGYCDEQGEMVLVYEFMAKGTLRDHLYGTSNSCLPWKRRLEICICAARGLEYLHTGSSQAIIHRDVKSANILLDENFQAKVADFGLSKLGPMVDQTHVSTGVKGSFGYLDPEYFRTQQLTEKSDVYSLGVVLLEVICARPAINPSLPYEQVNLADWGISWLRRGEIEQIVDPRIRDEINPGSLRKFGELVEKCLAPFGVDRPSMTDILWSLDYALKLQETAVRRDAYEDSVSGVSTFPAVNIQRMPSTNTKGWDIGNSVTNASVEMGESNVFSQIVTSEGR